jgi:hypothetical protein
VTDSGFFTLDRFDPVLAVFSQFYVTSGFLGLAGPVFKTLIDTSNFYSHHHHRLLLAPITADVLSVALQN